MSQTSSTRSTAYSFADPHPLIAKKPFITIARDPGSGGKPIAQLVAKQLKFKFYNKALVEEIAKSAKLRSQVIKNVDENTRTYIQDVIHGLFNPEYISDTTYIKHLSRTILSIAHQGKAVILGRGANFIVHKDEGLNVLVTASKKTRVQRAITYEHISRSEAKDRIYKISHQRSEFISQYFRKYYTNPKHYDLILNTDHYDIESASKVIICAFAQKFPHFKLPKSAT
jgi:cytidylate kinase